MKILVTGTAGFIGYHLTKKLLKAGIDVVGVDNLRGSELCRDRMIKLGVQNLDHNDHKYGTRQNSTIYQNYVFYEADCTDTMTMERIFSTEQFDIVCHLAAWAGVRHSIVNPRGYIKSNIDGFLTILECWKDKYQGPLIYASSSSVYGSYTQYPSKEGGASGKPMNIYAMTKIANEDMAFVYNNIYHMPTIGLRFFTVYGPWGRPDMFYHVLADSIYDSKTIRLYNHGNMYRDFTYIDDIVEGIFKIIHKESSCNEINTIYNLGSAMPVKLTDFVDLFEEKIGIEAIKEYWPMPAGDVQYTFADMNNYYCRYGTFHVTPLSEGIEEFLDWYKEYHNIL